MTFPQSRVSLCRMKKIIHTGQPTDFLFLSKRQQIREPQDMVGRVKERERSKVRGTVTKLEKTDN